MLYARLPIREDNTSVVRRMLITLGFLLDVGTDPPVVVQVQPVEPALVSIGTLVPVPVRAIQDLSQEATWCEESGVQDCSYTCVVSGLAQVLESSSTRTTQHTQYRSQAARKGVQRDMRVLLWTQVTADGDIVGASSDEQCECEIVIGQVGLLRYLRGAGQCA